ncbi:cysteine-rich receptor-like protein kinase 8, partial [Tanacetum coccineum]
ESQRGVFRSSNQLGIQTTALYRKNETKEKCSICGYKWHLEEKYWEKVGYPAWHYKSKQSHQKGKGKSTNSNTPSKRTAAAVESGNVVFTSKQFEQLMKSLPHFNVQNLNKGKDSDEVLDHYLAAGGDCVVIATYLINRFPSVVLGNKTPYEILMNKKLSYSNLKVFGCLAVASNPSRVIDKMAPRGVPCLFLGYPPHQKGYTLINLLTHTRFVSRDVTFYERIFPYSKSSMSGVRSS